MKRTPQRDTSCEIAVRKLLFSDGFRYRTNVRVGRAYIDIAFTRYKVAVFVDGCFWHSCPLHATYPKRNAKWWADKLAATKSRDIRIAEQLRQSGWLVLRFWEHQAPKDVLPLIRSAYDQRKMMPARALLSARPS